MFSVNFFRPNFVISLCVTFVQQPFVLGSLSNMSTTSEGISPGQNSVAFVTVPTIESGKVLSHGVLKNKLAACVNIIPQITSIYEWEGQINEDSEALLMIKTKTSRVDDLTEFVRKNHPYAVCEVISLPIQNGNPAYLEWINSIVPSKQNVNDLV